MTNDTKLIVDSYAYSREKNQVRIYVVIQENRVYAHFFFRFPFSVFRFGRKTETEKVMRKGHVFVFHFPFSVWVEFEF